MGTGTGHARLKVEVQREIERVKFLFLFLLTVVVSHGVDANRQGGLGGQHSGDLALVLGRGLPMSERSGREEEKVVW